jgi:hypothetical protein
VNRLIKRIGERAGFAFPVHAHMLRHGCGYRWPMQATIPARSKTGSAIARSNTRSDTPRADPPPPCQDLTPTSQAPCPGKGLAACPIVLLPVKTCSVGYRPVLQGTPTGGRANAAEGPRPDRVRGPRA